MNFLTSTPQPKATRFDCATLWQTWKFWLLLAVVYLGFLYPSPNAGLFNKDDSSQFIVMARNIAVHGHYSTDTYQRTPYGRHATWPPVFPLYMAGTIRLFGVNWIALKAAMAILGIATIFLLKVLFSQDPAASPLTVVGAVTLTALSPIFFAFSHDTMTEIPFIFLCTATMCMQMRARTWRGAFVAGVLATLAFLTRGYAVAFLPAGFLYFILKPPGGFIRRVANAIAFSSSLCLGIVGWSVYTAQVIKAGYCDNVTKLFGNGSDLHLNVAQQLMREVYWYHLRTLSAFFFPCLDWKSFLDQDYLAWVGVVLVVLISIGWYRSLLTAPNAVTYWFPSTLAVLLLVHVTSPRYLLTLLPFSFYFALIAIQYLVDRVRWPRNTSKILVGLLIMVSVGGLMRHLYEPNTIRFLSPYWNQYCASALWTDQHLPQDAKVITHTAHIFNAISGRECYDTEFVTTRNLVDVSARSEKSCYIVYPKHPEPTLKPPAANALQGVVDRCRGEVVYSSDDVEILRIARFSAADE